MGEQIFYCDHSKYMYKITLERNGKVVSVHVFCADCYFSENNHILPRFSPTVEGDTMKVSLF